VRKTFNSVCDSVCLSVCPHDKTKMAETKITKLGTGIVHHDNTGSKGQGHTVKKMQKGDRVTHSVYCPASS